MARIKGLKGHVTQEHPILGDLACGASREHHFGRVAQKSAEGFWETI